MVGKLPNELLFSNELLFRIVSYLTRDVPALRTAALLSRPLLPIAREELFKAINILALECEYMQPYLHLVRELYVTGKAPPESSRRFPPTLSDRSLPELRALRFLDVDFGTTDMAYLEALGALGIYSNITSLSLSRVVIPHASDLHNIINDLPTLTTLLLDRVTFSDPRGREVPEGGFAPILAFPRLINRLRYPDTDASPPSLSSLHIDGDGPSAIAALWLQGGPTGHSLTTLSIGPHAASFGRLRLFLYRLGRKAPLEHFTAPMRILHAAGRMSNPPELSATLRTLTLFVDAYDPDEPSAAEQWSWLASDLRGGFPAEHLEALTVLVPLPRSSPRAVELDRVVCWPVIDELNDELVKDRYAALQRVTFAVEWAEGSETAREDAEALMNKLAGRLHNLGDAGKLIVRCGVLREIP